MAFLYSSKARKFMLTIILVWGMSAFYFSNPDNWLILGPMIAISLLGLFLIYFENSPIFLLILLSFTTSYAFSIFFSQFNLPTWILMLGILLVFGYLFTYTEQKIGILGNKRLIYLVLFSLIILETFITLTYFLVSPISQSLIISAISYLFVGFCYTVLAKHTDNKFTTYISLTVIIIILVLLTAGWGGRI